MTDQELIVKEIEKCLGYNNESDPDSLEFSFSESGELEELWLNGIVVPDEKALVSLLKSMSGLKNLRSSGSIKNVSVLTELQQLHSLSLMGLEGTQDLESLNKLTNLQTLDFSHSKIYRIPSFSGLKNLHSLNLSHSHITDISSLSDLPYLKSLDLGGNRIEDISVLAGLCYLEDLYLQGNKVSDFIPLKGLEKLNCLEISNNDFIDTSLFDGLTRLEFLGMSSMHLTDISFLRNMSNLVELNLESNNISDISCLENMPLLDYLILNNNRISDISPLRECKKLRVLELSNNKIEDISCLENFYLLEYFNIQDNKVKDIGVLSNSQKLETIELGSNRIEDASPLAGLECVEELNLGFNRITDISSLKKVVKTAKCYFHNNNITSLPEWVTDLNVYLLLNEEDPYSFEFEEDSLLFLNDNPLTDPPLAIIKRGMNSVRRYFERKKKEAFSSIREAKLILVGDGASGKTSLSVRLQNSKAELPTEDKRTRGIHVDDWEFRKGFVAHIWDFGGQDVYYPVHRFFMTENAVFVLLASTRDEKHSFDYWIPTIFQFGGSSLVIIGQTCHEGNTVRWNDLGDYISRPGLNIIKTSVQPYYELNLPRRNKGLADIRKVIIQQLCQLPHCRKDVPVSWIRVRDLLKEMSVKEPCITYDDFTKVCIKEFPEDNQSAEGFEDCCTFLHYTGALFWYSDNALLRGYVILDPDWAVRAVYKIIDDEKIQERTGHIVASDFSRLWKEVCYRNRYDILKQMLVVFRVAFPKRHKPEEFIIPARLISVPDGKHWNPDGCVKLYYKYETFMPRGIVNQLSAELSRYIVTDKERNEEVWNNAVHFTSEDGDCQVYEAFYDKQIVLLAKGLDPRANIKLVMNALKDIHDQYKGVNPDIVVPCRCKSCTYSEHVTLFTYSDLIRWYKERGVHATVFCNESGTTTSISHLLAEVGLHIPGVKTMYSGADDKTIRIFLASSFELKEEREEFEEFVGRRNKRLREKGVFLHLDIWEDLPLHMSQTRSQDEYNKKVRESDIFICLCFSRMGKYTEEEFDLALATFKDIGKPRIYVFIKEPPFPAGIDSSQLKSREDFIKKLDKLKYFPIRYKAAGDFVSHMKDQLEEVLLSKIKI